MFFTPNAERQTPTRQHAVSALTPLGKQSRWIPDYKNNYLLNRSWIVRLDFYSVPPDHHSVGTKSLRDGHATDFNNELLSK
jgi:hypothetical protein